jgi:transcriptional regulator with XRE-family HTH domain
MTLGEYIKQYREAHGLSQRRFATMCGLSNGYISMLEKNVNPKTGKPVTPQLERIAMIASAMGTTVQDLFLTVDDMPISLIIASEKKTATDNGSGLSEKLVDAISKLSESGQQQAMSFVLYLLENEGKE